MPGSNAPERLVPAFRVRVNSSDLPPQAMADLVAVTVFEDVGAPGMFTLELINWDMAQLKVTWADDDLFAEGNETEIQMGYVDDLETLMVGEITGLEPEFHSDEIPMLTVRGYDRRHRLLRGRQTRSFTQMRDSDIARQIAGDLGLAAQVEDTQIILDYVLQHNQTDMEFLQERAQRIGYEVVVEDKTLHFRSHQNAGGEVLTLTRDGDLIEFYPRLTTVGQVGQVKVRSWTPRDKATVVAQANAGDEATTMGGATTGPRASANAFGRTSVAIVDRPVFSQAEADQIALARFNDLALTYVTGEAACIGRTDLRAGAVVDIQGMGRRFSGRYYVTSTRHTCSSAQGYRTAFTMRRNAT